MRENSDAVLRIGLPLRSHRSILLSEMHKCLVGAFPASLPVAGLWEPGLCLEPRAGSEHALGDNRLRPRFPWLSTAPQILSRGHHALFKRDSHFAQGHHSLDCRCCQEGCGPGDVCVRPACLWALGAWTCRCPETWRTLFPRALDVCCTCVRRRRPELAKMQFRSILIAKARRPPSQSAWCLWSLGPSRWAPARPHGLTRFECVPLVLVALSVEVCVSVLGCVPALADTGGAQQAFEGSARVGVAQSACIEGSEHVPHVWWAAFPLQVSVLPLELA